MRGRYRRGHLRGEYFLGYVSVDGRGLGFESELEIKMGSTE